MALVAAALLVHGYAVRAAPLDKDDCAKLKTEQSLLEQDGARGNMGRGPEWAKANLAPDKLEQIRRLIELDEQLLFRCQGKPLVNLREAVSQPQAREAEPKAPVAKAVKGHPVKKTAATPPGAAEKGAAKAPPAARASAAPTSAPAKENPKAPGGNKAEKSKTKRKANDAYRPPPADWPGNPFAEAAPAAKK
jgi:hypothetical protein